MRNGKKAARQSGRVAARGIDDFTIHDLEASFKLDDVGPTAQLRPAGADLEAEPYARSTSRQDKDHIAHGDNLAQRPERSRAGTAAMVAKVLRAIRQS